MKPPLHSSWRDLHGCSKPSNLFIIRHGARHDQLVPGWKDEVSSLGLDVRDPPLSALGHQQARETAAFLGALPASQRPEWLLVSPYLRVIQTAAPSADALGLRLHTEEGLAEIHHVLGQLPSPVARLAYFPQMVPSSSSLCAPVADTTDPQTGLAAESYPRGYLARLRALAPRLSAACDGKNVACFSHAASSALVAALLGEADLEAVGAFAPVGVFHLACAGGGAPWVLLRRGGENPHVIENHPATYPWSHPESAAGVWRELLREGRAA